MNPLLQLSQVSKTFSEDPLVRPLHHVDLSVASGSVVCISGVSGKGKTTLLNIAGGLLRPDEGKVLFCGECISDASVERLDEIHRQGIGFIFQVPYLVEALTVKENLQLAARVAHVQDAANIDTLITDFGLADRADHMPHELSVGQKRRVVIARAFLQPHSLILADEPTNDLDDEWSDFVFSRLRNFAQEDERAVVVVTHDNRYAQRADVRYQLQDGALNLVESR